MSETLQRSKQDIADVQNNTYTLNVTKIDAGVATLLTPEHYMIEFPAILLPQNVSAGSIIKISVARDNQSELAKLRRFEELQRIIMDEYGQKPHPPSISLRIVTQYIAIFELVEWDSKNVDIYGIDVYKNGQREPNPNIIGRLSQRRIKITNLTPNTAYTFKIDIVTSAGILSSNVVSCQTRSSDDLTGLVVAFVGFPDNPEMDESSLTSYSLRRLRLAVERMGAKWTSDLSIDNTHLIYRAVTIGDTSTHDGVKIEESQIKEYHRLYDQAAELNIPIITPEWLYTCLDLQKLKPTAEYFARKSA